jgi:hypothetical protein
MHHPAVSAQASPPSYINFILALQVCISFWYNMDQIKSFPTTHTRHHTHTQHPIHTLDREVTELGLVQYLVSTHIHSTVSQACGRWGQRDVYRAALGVDLGATEPDKVTTPSRSFPSWRAADRSGAIRKMYTRKQSVLLMCTYTRVSHTCVNLWFCLRIRNLILQCDHLFKNKHTNNLKLALCTQQIQHNLWMYSVLMIGY